MVIYLLPLIFYLQNTLLLSISIYYAPESVAGTGTYKAEQDRYFKLHMDKTTSLQEGVTTLLILV